MFRRFLPSHDAIRQSRLLRWLGPRLHDPLLWHINRRAVARGVAVGAFFGLMIPVAQIPAAALASLVLRGNLWIAAVSTLVSNPLTYGPIYYFAYRLGADVIGAPAPLVHDRVEAPVAMLDSLAQAWHWITGIGQPLLVGMAIMAVAAAVLGYWGAQLFWRIRIMSRRRHQRRTRQLKAARASRPLGST